MANTMDVDVAGCNLKMEIFPPITMKYYAGTRTALDAATTYPYTFDGRIAGTDLAQFSLAPMVGQCVKWKDIDTYDAPVVEGCADSEAGRNIIGVITHIAAKQDTTAYFDVAVYMFQIGDVLKLLSDTGGTAPSHGDSVSMSDNTNKRAFEQDNTTGTGLVIKSAPAAADDFLLVWTGFSNNKLYALMDA